MLNNPSITELNNRIINGACNIAVRGSLVASTGVSGYGGPDRYFANNANSAGGSFTQSQGTITYNGNTLYTVMQTVGTAVSSTTSTNYWSGICQIIEGFYANSLLGNTITVSFLFNASLAGTYSLALRDSGNGNSYVTAFNIPTGGVVTPIRVTIPVPTNITIPASTAVGLSINIGALNTGTYQQSTGNLNAWQTGNFFAAQGATNWGATASNTIAVTNFQVKIGIPTYAYDSSTLIDQHLCYRYYYKHIGSSANSTVYLNAGVGRAYSTTNGQVALGLPSPMRSLPSFSYSALTDWNPAGGTITAMLVSNITTDFRWVTIDITASFTSGAVIILNGNNTSSAYLSFSSELTV